MKSIQHYIIKLENPYSKTFKTASGLELYGNIDFTADRQSNRVAKIVAVPQLNNSEIKENDEVLIDFSSFYRQIYQGIKQGYNAVVDEDKHLYFLSANMIICYRSQEKKENSEKGNWKGFGKNCLVEPVFESSKFKKSSLILPKSATSKTFKGKVKMIYANKELNEFGVKNDDILYMDKIGGVKYWIEGKEYWWIRNKDIFAKTTN